jgi:hypothetical protein
MALTSIPSLRHTEFPAVQSGRVYRLCFECSHKGRQRLEQAFKQAGNMTDEQLNMGTLRVQGPDRCQAEQGRAAQ